ncbi:MAG TPA: hypothetical protein VJK51_05805 [Candidatus Nanoarchaeia archaeon]|nr:hypothetical protein [Candidatus Nanoarchaeia archaeon]
MIHNKRAEHSSLVIRIIAGFIITLSLPFLITMPSNTVAIVSFAFGNFLMVLGGLLP